LFDQLHTRTIIVPQIEFVSGQFSLQRRGGSHREAHPDEYTAIRLRPFSAINPQGQGHLVRLSNGKSGSGSDITNIAPNGEVEEIEVLQTEGMLSASHEESTMIMNSHKTSKHDESNGRAEP
jgi:hypothetical protein